MDKYEATHTVYEKDNIARSYAKSHDDILIIKNHADAFMASLPGKRIMDIGCGPGRDVKYFYDNGLDVIGVDTSSKLIHMARQKAPGAIFALMDMRDVGNAYTNFDGIWSCGSFYHIEKKYALDALKGFYNVLRTGGQLYLSVKEGKTERFIKRKEFLGERKFYAFYQMDELVNLIEKAGFTVTRTKKEYKKTIWLNVFAIKE